jgi:acetyl esterase/lipase
MKRKAQIGAAILTVSCSLSGCSERGESSPPIQPASSVQTPAEAPKQQPAVKVDRKKLPLAKRPIVYYVEGMEEVEVRRDIVYKTLPDQTALEMDVYLPENLPEGKKVPAVILVHGGAAHTQRLKDTGQYTSWGQLIAKSEMAAVTFNYRGFTDDKSLAEGYSDVQDLLHYVREHADEWHIDPDRLGIWTCSGGGPVGLRHALQDKPPYIRAIAALYARMDLQDMRSIIDSKIVPDQMLRDFSPVYHLGKHPQKIAPLLVVKAGEDSSDLNESIDRFVKVAKEKQGKVEYVEHPHGDHAFDLINDDEISRRIIQRTIAFFQEQLTVP